MLIRSIKRVVKKHFEENHTKYFMLIVLYGLGAVLGSVYFHMQTVMQKKEMVDFLIGITNQTVSASTGKMEYFNISFMQCVRYFILLWISGLLIIGMPLVYLTLSYKGFISGFTSSVAIYACGVKGILFNFVVILPGELFLTLGMLVVGVLGINFSMALSKKKPYHLQKEKELRQRLWIFTAETILILFVVSLFCGLYSILSSNRIFL